MDQWTSTTKKIISSHTVTASTYDEVMEAAGGFDNYVRSLGGVFAKWHGVTTKVQTVTEFWERVEYVQGLMSIFRFCYWNGKTWYFWLNSSAQAFYSTRQTKTCPSGTIAQLCSGASGKTRITNCNYGVDTLSKALGSSIWSCDYEKMLNNGATKITDKAKLLPGDLVHFFTKGVWKHVAIVKSVEDGEIVLADFGSRFIKTGNPLHLFPSEYSNYGSNWLAVRWLNLKDDVKRIDDLAVELKREVDSYLAFKKAEAGEEVYNTMAMYRQDQDAYLRAAADYVLEGFAGNGEARQVFFGDDYDAVQEKVNWVITTAQEVIAGVYGTGEVRKAALGADYYVVQAQVNRILKG